MRAALSVTLIHFLWEGALIALLLAILLQIFGSSSARLRYALACAALLAMPIAFALTFFLSLPVERASSFSTVATLRISSSGVSNLVGPPMNSRGFPNLVFLWMTGVACLYAYNLAAWFSFNASGAWEYARRPHSGKSDFPRWQ